MDKKNKVVNSEMKKNLYLVLMLLFLMITVTGGTYAYFALSASNENSIVGIAATTGLDLKVEKILPNGNVGVMVPQLEEYLDSAISTEYSCIDDNGNTVCQVYKATITNTSTATLRLDGTLKFSGINNMPNLKWKRITDERTIGQYSSKTAKNFSTYFESDRSFAKNESVSYYFVIWIDEIGSNQTDSGTFNVTIEFNPTNGSGLTSTIGQLNSYATDIMMPVATSDASINFSQTSEASNTNGVYIKSGTESNTYPIYYYRGNVDNNLIFADTCWKVIRTTETGGLKLLYNGVPTNGQCNNTGISSQIGESSFNDQIAGISGSAYMFGSFSISFLPDNFVFDREAEMVFGNDVIYSEENDLYTLTDTISGTWDDLYENGLANHHYTFFSDEITGTEVVYYVYNTSGDGFYFLTLRPFFGLLDMEIGITIEEALSNMLDYNTNSSVIKGDKNTEGTLDYWYYNNIEKKGYSSYIEDTVWCYDRSIASLGGFNPNGGLTYSVGEQTQLFNTMLGFSVFEKFWSATPTPNLSCSRDIDKFTVSESRGNGALDYPVGLLTADEIVLAGAGTSFQDNRSYYLWSGNPYWGGTPTHFINNGAYVTYVANDGLLNGNLVSDEIGVRPVISLAKGFTITGGNGTVGSPYIVG